MTTEISGRTAYESAQAAYDAGFDDGAEAQRGSERQITDCDGWDDGLINAVGVRGLAAIFGVHASRIASGDGLTPLARVLLAEYSRGCLAGAAAQWREQRAE